jgi:Protein of unknown function (DUF1579)
MKITFQARSALLGALLLVAAATPWAEAAAADKPARAAAALQSLDKAMTPGEGQKRLEPMIGTFDVTVLVWIDRSNPPLEYKGSAVNTWVLGGRYVQTMLAAVMDGEVFDSIGYYGFDNATRTYQVTWMDNGSTAISWYRGTLDKSGRSALLKSVQASSAAGRPIELELRVSIAEGGDHVTQLWGAPNGGKAFKMMELRSVRTKK